MSKEKKKFIKEYELTGRKCTKEVLKKYDEYMKRIKKGVEITFFNNNLWSTQRKRK